ncbi:MAG: hypothetical protein H0T83_08170 [Chthoniobacterales bacterium]|nr:hypothetical protein [Chthoniobacterales bacterium]
MSLNFRRLALESLRGFRRSRLKLSVSLSLLLLIPGLFGLLANPAPELTHLKLLIAPSSSSLAGGTAKLDVDPLSRSGGKYVGDYRIKVFPYFFKNENGQLFISVSDPQVRQMVDGGVTSFTGQAQAKGSDITHKITAKATPASDGRGELTFTVSTDSGPLVFNTSYRMVGP